MPKILKSHRIATLFSHVDFLVPPLDALGHGLAANVADDPLVVLLPEFGGDAIFVVLLQSRRTEPRLARWALNQTAHAWMLLLHVFDEVACKVFPLEMLFI